MKDELHFLSLLSERSLKPAFDHDLDLIGGFVNRLGQHGVDASPVGSPHIGEDPVSYTHLEVYKRQTLH